MTPKQLERLGKASYGRYWKTPLANAVLVTSRTVRRWASGITPIKPMAADAIRAACSRRAVVRTTRNVS